MRRWLIRGVVFAAVLALGGWAWRVLFPDPEKAIRARLAEVEQLASFGPTEAPAAKLWNAQKLVALFTPDVSVKIVSPGQQGTYEGREAIQNAAMLARQNFGAFKVRFQDIIVTLAPDKQSAIAELTARAKVGAETDTFGPMELTLRMKKEGGKWLVSRVEEVRTLR